MSQWQCQRSMCRYTSHRHYLQLVQAPNTRGLKKDDAIKETSFHCENIAVAGRNKKYYILDQRPVGNNFQTNCMQVYDI